MNNRKSTLVPPLRAVQQLAALSQVTSNPRSNQADESGEPPIDQLLPEVEVRKVTGLSGSSIRRYAKAGLMPKPLFIGPNRRAWRQSEIVAWIASRKPASANTGA